MQTLRKRFLSVISIVFVYALIFWAAALPVFAQGPSGGGTKTLQNPLKFSSIETFIEGVLKAIVMVALPIITVFFVYAGFMFIKARGKSNELSDAKKNLVYVVVGAILILSAWVLATLIGGTVSQLLGN